MNISLSHMGSREHLEERALFLFSGGASTYGLAISASPVLALNRLLMWTKQEEGPSLPAPLCWHPHFLCLCKSYPIISQILGECYWILFLHCFLNCNDEVYKKKYKTVVTFRYGGLASQETLPSNEFVSCMHLYSVSCIEPSPHIPKHTVAFSLTKTPWSHYFLLGSDQFPVLASSPHFWKQKPTLL